MAEAAWDKRIGRRLRLRDLHILATVAQWGSMAKAASQLSMSQPAISEAIATLEAALRVPLLDRSPRGVSPTPYADALIRRSHAVFDELRQGIRDIEFLASPAAGEVRVASSETAVGGFLPALIDRLSLAYPQIDIRISPLNSETMEFRDLRERRVDLAFARIAQGFREDDLEVEMLFEDPHRVVVGERSPWARRRKIELSELAKEPWLFASTRVVRELIGEAFRANGVDAPREYVTASSILLRNHLLATGRFVTVLSDSVLRYNAGLFPIKALPVELKVKPRSIAMMTLKGRTVSSVVELFMEQARALAKDL